MMKEKRKHGKNKSMKRKLRMTNKKFNNNTELL